MIGKEEKRKRKGRRGEDCLGILGRSEENINKYIQVPTSILGMRGLGGEGRGGRRKERKKNRTRGDRREERNRRREGRTERKNRRGEEYSIRYNNIM